MDYIRERNELQFELTKRIDDKAHDRLKSCNAIIAGGAITSLFSNAPINDLDIYFQSENQLNQFKAHVKDRVKHNSERAVTLDNKVQLIKAVYGNKTKVFSQFDFTINMGAYLFSTNSFFFHSYFMPHLAQRKLVINPDTAYPLNTLLRVVKYINKGFHIQNSTLIALALLINRKTITTIEDLDSEVAGISEWFGFVDNLEFPKPFDFDTVMRFLQAGQIDFETSDDIYFKKIITQT